MLIKDTTLNCNINHMHPPKVIVNIIYRAKPFHEKAISVFP